MSLPVQSAPILPTAVERKPVPAHQAITAKAGDKKAADAKTDDSFSFADLIDIINPLQHIPVVSSIYRELTGDTIKGPARVLGGALFGGAVGAILGGVNAVVASENNGKDVGALAMNKVGLGSKEETAKVETKTADKKKDEEYPVIEVRPLANNFTTLPLDKSPFASIKSADIKWDDAPKQVAALPDAKSLNDLQPVAGFDPAFEDKPIVTADASPESLNAIEPGTPAENLSPESIAAVDKAMEKLMAASQKVPTSAEPAAAPISANQIPTQMMSALSKYQAMQNISDKAVISPKVGNTPAEMDRPFANLDRKIRRVASN